MRLILAALFVFVGLLVFANLAGTFEEEFARASTPVVAAVVFAYGSAVLWLAFRLFGDRAPARAARERRANARREASSEAGLRPDPDFRYALEITTTRRDLLDAHAAVRRDVTGLRPWVRGLVIAMGALWLTAFASWVMTEGVGGAGWVWLLLGGGVFWFFVVRQKAHRWCSVAILLATP